MAQCQNSDVHNMSACRGEPLASLFRLVLNACIGLFCENVVLAAGWTPYRSPVKSNFPVHLFPQFSANETGGN
jgi:hypothetical protein